MAEVRPTIPFVSPHDRPRVRPTLRLVPAYVDPDEEA